MSTVWTRAATGLIVTRQTMAVTVIGIGIMGQIGDAMNLINAMTLAPMTLDPLALVLVDRMVAVRAMPPKATLSAWIYVADPSFPVSFALCAYRP